MPPLRAVTHTVLGPKATSFGLGLVPTANRATTRLVAGSMRNRVGSEMQPAQTAESFASMLYSVHSSSMTAATWLLAGSMRVNKESIWFVTQIAFSVATIFPAQGTAILASTCSVSGLMRETLPSVLDTQIAPAPADTPLRLLNSSSGTLMVALTVLVAGSIRIRSSPSPTTQTDPYPSAMDCSRLPAVIGAAAWFVA